MIFWRRFSGGLSFPSNGPNGRPASPTDKGTWRDAGTAFLFSVAHYTRDMKRSALAKTLKQAEISLAEFLRHDP